MAVVYSLVCWGGLTGRSVNAVPASNSFTHTNHGQRDGSKRWFNPAGGVPTGLSAGVPYYTKSTGANSFQLYLDSGLTTLATFTGGGSTSLWSDITVDPAVLAAYGVTIDRYENRIYSSFQSAESVRGSAALPSDDEVIEFGEAFDETGSAMIPGSGFAQSYTFTTTINDIRTPAFHGGVVGGGHTYTASGNCFYLSQENVTIDGFDWRRNTSSNGGTVISVGFGNCVFANNIVQNIGSGWCNGIDIRSGAVAYNNLVIGISPGRTDAAGIAMFSGAVVYNNTVTKCGVGFAGLSSGGTSANTYNNLSVGNETNWGIPPLYTATRANGNIGELRDLVPFTVSGNVVTLPGPDTFLRTNYQVFLSSTGTLPSVAGVPLRTDRTYYLRAVSGSNTGFALAYNGGPLTFSSPGTGVHTISRVWSTTNSPSNYIDFSNPDLVFKDWANNDLRPAGTGATPAAQAKMVDAARTVRRASITRDIVGNVRPNYNNGGPEGVDVGAFEYDHGFGPRPATHTLTLTNVVVGSRISIQDGALTTIHYNAVAATSTVVIPVTVYGDARDEWRIKVRKGSESPFYQPFLTQITAFAGSQTIFVSQIPDE